jgi:hypothetical protein
LDDPRPLTQPVVAPAEKRCSHCKREKRTTEFDRCANAKTGLQSWCKACMRSRPRPKELVSYVCEGCGQLCQRVARSRYVEPTRRKRCTRCAKRATMEANGGHSTNYNGSEYFAGRMICSWKDSARRRGYVWALTKEQLDKKYKCQGGHCAFSGLPMGGDFGSGRRPSIDRIDPRKGYVKGNFQFVCAAINMMRNKLSVNDFLFWCRAVADNRKLHDTRRQDAGG